MNDQKEALQQEYRLRFSKLEAYRDQVWNILCAEYFSRHIRPTDRVLDLGCGWGEFSNNIRASQQYAMDLNPDAPQRLRQGVEFLHQDCSQPWPLEPESLDVVFTSNFLEHLPNKSGVEATIGHAYQALKRGGKIICLGPNIKYVPGAYWDFWDHYIPLTEQSVAELLRLQQFQVESCIPRFLPYSMSDGGTPPLIFVKLYLKMPFAWPWFGKQFLVIATKN